MSAKAIAVILKPLIDLFGLPNNWKTAAPIYVEILQDIPPHLLQAAVQQALATCSFFPKPAELRAAIAGELETWREHRDEAWRAALPKPPDPPPPSAEDIAYVERALAPMRHAMAARTAFIKDEK